MIAYKFITKDWKSKEGNIQWKLNEWQKHKGKIELCKSGFHACKTPLQALEYIYGDCFVMVEYKGKIKEKKGDKFVCSQMRVIKEIPEIILKRFAIAQAKSCLANYEKEYPEDKRVSDCIKAAEDYLDGKIKLEDLSAAESAAWSAARSAAESAAESAARSAAESAAWSAAWSAARSAAESAARSAARSAAESAARSAAESAARSAARSAAESAASKLLIKMIKEYFKNGKNK